MSKRIPELAQSAIAELHFHSWQDGLPYSEAAVESQRIFGLNSQILDYVVQCDDPSDRQIFGMDGGHVCRDCVLERVVFLVVLPIADCTAGYWLRLLMVCLPQAATEIG